MTRKKTRLAYIEKDTARKTCLRKRRASIFKKAGELSILCDVEAFAIVYSPDEGQTVAWPSPVVAQRLLNRLQSMPDTERFRKMVSHESYLWERIGKMQEQCRKTEKKNKGMEMGCFMREIYCQGRRLEEFGIIELHVLVGLLKDKMDEIGRRVHHLKELPPVPAAHFARQARGEGPEDETEAAGGGSGAGVGNPAAAMLMMSNAGDVAGPSGVKSGIALPDAFSVGGIADARTNQRIIDGDFGLGLRITVGNDGRCQNPTGPGLPLQANTAGSTSGSNMGLPGMSGGSSGAGDT